MAAPCTDIESLIQTYLDGELAELDLQDFERHVADCGGCAGKLRAEEEVLGALRDRLAAPGAPDILRRRLGVALDGEDLRAVRAVSRVRRSWVLPGLSVAAASAALVLFAAHFFREAGPPEEPEVAREAARHLFETPVAPIAVSEGGSRPELWQAAQEYTRLPVRPPRFFQDNVRLRGFQPGWLLGQRAALFVYEIQSPTGRHRIHVHTLDARDLDLRSRDRRQVAGGEIWVSRALGLSSVTFKDETGVGYVISSDIELDQLVDLVSRSDLLFVASDGFRGE